MNNEQLSGKRLIIDNCFAGVYKKSVSERIAISWQIPISLL